MKKHITIKFLLTLCAAALAIAVAACAPVVDDTRSQATSSPTSTPTPVPTATPLPDYPSGESFSVEYTAAPGYKLDFIDSLSEPGSPDGQQVLPLGDYYLAVVQAYTIEEDKTSDDEPEFEAEGGGSSSFRRAFRVYNVLSGEKCYEMKDIYSGIAKASRGQVFFFDLYSSTLYVFSADAPDKPASYDLGRYIPIYTGLDGQETFDDEIYCIGNTFYYASEFTLYAVDLRTMDRSEVLTADVSDEFEGDTYCTLYGSADSDHLGVSFSWYHDSICSDFYYLVKPDGTYFRLNLSEYSTIYPCDGGDYLIYDYDTRMLRRLEGLATRSITLPKESFIKYLAGGQVLVFGYGDDSDSLRGYNFDLGTMTFLYTTDQGSPYDCFFMMGGRYVVYSDYSGSVYAIPYDASAVSEHQPDPLQALDPEPASRSGNNSLANRISKEYGVEIHIYEDAIQYYSGYAAITATDDEKIHEALKTLEICLSRFPKGFFEELTSYGDLHQLDFMLVGRLINGDETSVSNPIGYASSDYGTNRKMLVMDITSGEFESTVYHEIMHYIDDQSFYANCEGIGDGMSGWYDYNPPGFGYYLSYVDETGSDYYDTDYTVGFSDDPYFVDYYCKTFATEDKSRTFEAIMMADGTFGKGIDYPHTKAKMQYLVRSLQTTFTTWKDLDQFDWYTRLFAESE